MHGVMSCRLKWSKQDRHTEAINRYSPVKLVSYSGNTMGETLGLPYQWIGSQAEIPHY